MFTAFSICFCFKVHKNEPVDEGTTLGKILKASKERRAGMNSSTDINLDEVTVEDLQQLTEKVVAEVLPEKVAGAVAGKASEKTEAEKASSKSSPNKKSSSGGFAPVLKMHQDRVEEKFTKFMRAKILVCNPFSDEF